MAFSDPEQNIEQLELQPGAHVADLGSGSGFYTFGAARAIGHDGKVYSVEVQKDLLERIKKEADAQNLHNIEIIWGNIEKVGGTKLRDRAMDDVIISNVLFQIENKADFIKETKRILKPRGKVLLIDWSESFGGMGPARESLFSKEKARDLFETAGFECVREISAGNHHYGLILRLK